MPVTKEFTVLMDDRPGTLGEVCRALADRNVNLLALHSFPIGGKSVARFIADIAPFLSYIRSLHRDSKQSPVQLRLFLIEGASHSWEFGYREVFA